MHARSNPLVSVVSPNGDSVSLRGDIEDSNLSTLLAILAPLETAGGTLHLSGLTFLPSRAVGEIVMAARRATRAGVRIRLVAAPGTIAAAILRAVALEHDQA